MAWWFVQSVKAMDMSDIQNANAALNVEVLVSSKKRPLHLFKKKNAEGDLTIDESKCNPSSRRQ